MHSLDCSYDHEVIGIADLVHTAMDIAWQDYSNSSGDCDYDIALAPTNELLSPTRDRIVTRLRGCGRLDDRQAFVDHWWSQNQEPPVSDVLIAMCTPRP